MGSKSRVLLIASMGGLLILLAVTGVSSIVVLARMRSADTALRERYRQASARLQQIRGAVYLSGTLARDYFVDAGSAAALARLEQDTLHTLDSAEAVSLRGEASAYFRLLDFMIEMQRKRPSPGVDAWFRRQMAGRRSAMLDLAAAAEATLDREWQAGQRERDRLYARFAWMLGGGTAGLLVLGGVIALVAARRVQALEMRTRELTAQLVETQEEERRSIARELHDEVGQSLNAALLAAGSGALRERLEAAIGAVRRMALALRPSMLDDLGLVPALEWQARETGYSSGIYIEVKAEDSAGELPDTHRTCIFRVAQEALRNCMRHSGAKRVEVALERGSTQVILRVEDDGGGFQPSRTRGLGLMGMQERVERLGGKFAVRSEPGRGAAVVAELPL